MATVELNWQRVSTTGGDEIHRCEVKARNGKDALCMEVHGGKLTGGIHIVTATSGWKTASAPYRSTLWDIRQSR